MRYRIVWQFDSDAESPLAAARDAQTREGTTATVFEVTDTVTGETTTVDLMEVAGS